MKYFIIFFIIIMAVVLLVIYKTFQLPSKIKKAEEFIDNGEYSKASEIVRKILERKKEFAPARYLKAQLLMKQGQYLLSISEFNSILSISGFNKFVSEVDIHYYLADLYAKTNNYQKEIEEYKIILTYNPDDVKANYRLGHALYQKKNYKKVKKHLTAAIILDPTLTDCYMPLGVSCFNISDFEKAEQYLLKSMDGNNSNYEAQYYLGLIYRMKKEYDTAIKMLESARENKLFFLKSSFALGGIYFEKGEYLDAIEILEGGLKNLSDTSNDADDYRYLLAECYEMENKISEAYHHWEKIAVKNPNYKSTRQKLDSYKMILENQNLSKMFTASLEELQPTIVEIISSLNYNIVSKEKISQNEYQYKAYNIKRNDQPILIYFNRTTREITENEIVEFSKQLNAEKCKHGIYITTSKYSIRSKTSASSKMIELYDSDHVAKSLEKIFSRKKKDRS